MIYFGSSKVVHISENNLIDEQFRCEFNIHKPGYYYRDKSEQLHGPYISEEAAQTARNL